MTSRNPTILLADDHTMFAECLTNLLQDDFELLGTVGDGQALVETARIMNPDVIVVDISMPVLNGFDAVRQLKKEGTRARIIFLTMHGDEGLVAEAFRCGASGYVLKQSAGDELITAIKQVLSGNDYLTPLIVSSSERKPNVEDAAHGTRVTRRQREVLQLIAEGQTMKEVAARLGISTRTAESHKYDLMEVLGIDNTAELIRYAIALGLVSE